MDGAEDAGYCVGLGGEVGGRRVAVRVVEGVRCCCHAGELGWAREWCCAEISRKQRFEGDVGWDETCQLDAG